MTSPVFFGNIAAGGPPFRDGRVKILAIADTRRPLAASARCDSILRRGQQIRTPRIDASRSTRGPASRPRRWLESRGSTGAALASGVANAAVEVIKTTDVQAKFRAASVHPISNSPAEMAAFIKEEAERIGIGAQHNGTRLAACGPTHHVGRRSIPGHGAQRGLLLDIRALPIARLASIGRRSEEQDGNNQTNREGRRVDPRKAHRVLHRFPSRSHHIMSSSPA